MRASNYLIMLLLFLGSCVEPYHPDIQETQELLVINGNITNQPGDHFIEISLSSAFNEPDKIPLEGCVVRVEDDQGMGVTYTEFSPGLYKTYLDESFLGVGKAYKLYVFAPDGEEYQSDYDSLLAGPPLDSLYYLIESQLTENPNFTDVGIQFYVDVKGESGQSMNFLWSLEETYEYIAPYRIEYHWDGVELEVIKPPIDYLSNCYMSNSLSEFYTASSRYLASNKLTHLPLNYVSSNIPKLMYKYSLLVSQHTLTGDAYVYWDKMRELQNEGGGLYEKQPSSSKGNIYNANDDREQVLGYFFASQVHEKRITVKNTFEFPVKDYFCPIYEISDFSEFGMDVYLYSRNPSGNGAPYGFSEPGCFDCTRRGGTTQPPTFWYDDE